MRNLWSKFNPGFDDFLEEHPGKTLLGVFWALYWRFAVFVWFVVMTFLILASFFGLLFGR